MENYAGFRHTILILNLLLQYKYRGIYSMLDTFSDGVVPETGLLAEKHLATWLELNPLLWWPVKQHKGLGQPKCDSYQ